MRAGQSVVVSECVTRWPWVTIAKGERGTIIDHDAEANECFIQFDKYHPGLAGWRNGAPLRLGEFKVHCPWRRTMRIAACVATFAAVMGGAEWLLNTTLTDIWMEGGVDFAALAWGVVVMGKLPA